MKTRVPYIISLAAITGLLAITPNIIHAQTTDPLLANSADQSLFPQITAQPLDQAVPIGSNVVLSVQANNADACQWLRNGVPLTGQTNNVLTINKVGINDVGLYSCQVFDGGPIVGQMVPTRAASVQVEIAGSTAASLTAASATAAKPAAGGVMANGILGGGPIVVLGTPLLSGGSRSSCPGPYAGFVVYSKTISQGWGWAPAPGAPVLTAADGSGRTDTKIQYFGLYGDYGCAQTSVTINPAYSPVYEFILYFTNNVPASTNGYPLVLTGFNP
jgi:hypothetical protein